MTEKYIAVIDSGMGGLTVVSELRKIYPKENILFYGDTLNLPYGDKSNEEIMKLSSAIINLLKNYPLKAIIIACNTIDSNAGKYLKEISTVPIYGIIQPTSEEAAKVTKNNKIGIMATSASIKSQAYTKQLLNINPKLQIYPQDCPKLVPLIENGHFSKGDTLIEETIKEYLKPLTDKNIDTLILGCTHYPLLMDIFNKLVPNLNIISSSQQAVKNYEEHNNDCHQKQGNTKFYVSANADKFKENAERFLKNKIEIKEIR